MTELISGAIDREELCVELQRIKIRVPPRTEGRETEHTEIWTICRLLATMANCDRILYPLTLHHRDKPDFFVRTGDTEIGVEITEAVHENLARYQALAAKEFPSAFLDLGLSYFRPGARKMSREKMRELLHQNRLTSEGWVGDSAEREWADFMLGVVDDKLERLTQVDFHKFDRNWLSVYDNLHKPNIDLGKAIGFLRPLLQDHWQRSPGFDALFIEHDSIVACITANDAEHLGLNNLWR